MVPSNPFPAPCRQWEEQAKPPIRGNYQLGQTLGCADDVRWPHCLVGRKQNECLHVPALVARAIFTVPKALLRMPSIGLWSTIGTCLLSNLTGWAATKCPRDYSNRNATTDVPRDVVDRVNGFIVPVPEPGALRTRMLTFIREPELLAMMGSASREIAEQKFDVHKVNSLILGEMGIV